MSSFTWPAELFRPIINSGLLSEADLCAVSQASRFLRDEGQRALFRDPGEMTIASWSTGKMRREVGFFDAILASPNRLALMVHSYVQSTYWLDPADNILLNPHPDNDKLFTKMTESLKLMVNLTSFWSVPCHSEALEEPTSGMLIGCLSQCRFRLKTFIWGHCGAELKLLEEFLVFQNDIVSLEFCPFPAFEGAVNVDEADIQQFLTPGKWPCPNLDSLRGGEFWARIFLPGKTKLRFLDCAVPPIQSDCTDICDSVKTVQYWTSPPWRLFRQIVPYLSHLVVLEISGSRMQEVSNLPPGLPALRAIYFHNGSYAIAPTPEELASDSTYASLIFLRFKKLKFIDVDRFLGPPAPDKDDYDSETDDPTKVVTRRFVVSTETGKVSLTEGTPACVRDCWWNRRLIVAQVSADA